MATFDQIAWLPLVLGLSGIGVGLSWLAWKRRDLAAGLRGFGWSLMPVAAYFTGLLRLIWEIGSSLVDWAVRLVFSPTVWFGVMIGGVAVVCLGVAALLSRRRAAGPEVGSAKKAPRRAAPPPSAKPVGSTRSQPAPAVDSDLAEIEQILKKRGIT